MKSSDLQKSMAIAMFGGVVVSFAPILYALSDANPLTGAFFRMVYAIPFFIIIIWFRKAEDSRSTNTRLIALLAGNGEKIDARGAIFIAMKIAQEYNPCKPKVYTPDYHIAGSEKSLVLLTAKL